MMEIVITYTDTAKSIGPERYLGVEKSYIGKGMLCMKHSSGMKTIINLAHVAKYDIIFDETEKEEQE